MTVKVTQAEFHIQFTLDPTPCYPLSYCSACGANTQHSIAFGCRVCWDGAVALLKQYGYTIDDYKTVQGTTIERTIEERTAKCIVEKLKEVSAQCAAAGGATPEVVAYWRHRAQAFADAADAIERGDWRKP